MGHLRANNFAGGSLCFGRPVQFWRTEVVPRSIKPLSSSSHNRQRNDDEEIFSCAYETTNSNLGLYDKPRTYNDAKHQGQKTGPSPLTGQGL